MTNVFCFQKYKKEKEALELEELIWSAAETILEDLERSVREAYQENERQFRKKVQNRNTHTPLSPISE